MSGWRSETMAPAACRVHHSHVNANSAFHPLCAASPTAEIMAAMAQPSNRAKVLDDIVRVLTQNPFFDGVDWDWEYPGDTSKYPNTADANKQNFVTFVQALRQRLGPMVRRHWVVRARGIDTRAIIQQRPWSHVAA